MSSTTERSRAEAVRFRRRERAEKRISQSSVLATRPLPPITSRGVMTHAGPQRVAPSNTRRRYQSALSMPGVEVRMPAIHITSAGIRTRVLSVLLSLLLGTMLDLALTLPEFHVAAAQVTGNQRIGAEEINAVLGTTGQSIFMLKSADLETRLRLNFPEVASARVTIGLPNTMDVQVVERQPILLWQQGEGYTWIDADGVAFRPRGDAASLPASIIPVRALAAPAPSSVAPADPLSPVPYISPELVQAVQALAPSVPPGAPIEYDPKFGLGWVDSRGWKAFFGNSAKEMPLKLQVYNSLVDELAQKGIQPAFISIQYANAPYYRISQ